MNHDATCVLCLDGPPPLNPSLPLNAIEIPPHDVREDGGGAEPCICWWPYAHVERLVMTDRLEVFFKHVEASYCGGPPEEGTLDMIARARGTRAPM